MSEMESAEIPPELCGVKQKWFTLCLMIFYIINTNTGILKLDLVR